MRTRSRAFARFVAEEFAATCLIPEDRELPIGYAARCGASGPARTHETADALEFVGSEDGATSGTAPQ